MNNELTGTGKWCENVIIADADYIDKVAFDLIVNFERMLERRIPQADMARWIDCVALDGGLREGDNRTQVVLIHDKKNLKLDNFRPCDYADELDGKAFNDNLGEFTVSSLPVDPHQRRRGQGTRRPGQALRRVGAIGVRSAGSQARDAHPRCRPPLRRTAPRPARGGRQQERHCICHGAYARRKLPS